MNNGRRPSPTLVAAVTTKPELVTGDLITFIADDDEMIGKYVDQLERFLSARSYALRPNLVLLVQQH